MWRPRHGQEHVRGLQFLAEGLRRGEPALFVSVDRKPMHLIEDSQTFGWDLPSAIEQGALVMLDASPYFSASRGKWKEGLSVDARQIASDLAQQVRKVEARRFVIDSFTSLVPPEMTVGLAHDYLRSLILSLEDNLGCTALLTSRRDEADHAMGMTAHLVSGVLELKVSRDGRTFVRTLFVKKMRGTAAEPSEHVFVIDRRKGLMLLL